MKKQGVQVVEAPSKLKVGAGLTRMSKSANRNKGRFPKSAGKSEKLLVENDKYSPFSPSGSAKALSPHPCLLVEGKCSAETTKGFSILQQYPEHADHLSEKIKLQLFPLDEVTRMGLEKDGYHPYLELTLSARKKISSVLKHLNHKWAGSSIVTGEPILLPYNISEGGLTSCRWTMNDVGLGAGDVFAAVGSPSIFRLRYCWLSNSENKSAELQSTSTPSETCLQPQGIQKVCSSSIESLNGKGKQIEKTREESKPAIGNGATDVSVDKPPSNELVEPVQHEGKLHVGIGQSLWDDTLTNISIGGLLSEASLQGMFSACDPKSNGSNAGLHPSQFISDSFDAFIMSQVNCSQAPRLPPHGTSSSILDAEDTCHAFAFQKFSSSAKDAIALGGSTYSHTSSQDPVSKSSENRNASEVNIQSGLSQSRGCQESETDLSLGSRLYNDESSLGLSGIKWTDSLGPFDLGLSSSKKIISGDSLSISRIIS